MFKLGVNLEGKIIIIVAASGTGKSTLIKKIKKEFVELLESISYTTREKRVGEVDGTHYFFTNEKEFMWKKDHDEFIEWAEVHKNYYATSKEFVEFNIQNGKSLLFDLDVQGTDSFKKYFGDKAKAIFIAPPSLNELEKRLRERATESPAAIEVRINNAKNEILRKNDYDYCVINEDLNQAYLELRAIVKEILG